jgi:DNA-binding transcriptional regulator YiaG
MGFLDKLSKQFTGKSDAELENQLGELSEAKRSFTREHRNLKDDAHAKVDQFIAGELMQAEALLANVDERSVLDPQAVTALRETWPLRDEKFGQRLHRSVAEAGGEWSTLTRAAVDAKLAAFDSEITAIRTELQRREIAVAQEAASAALAELEVERK